MARPIPKRSFSGLNAANFFQAEMAGVIIPVTNVLLRQQGWGYGQIGVATAAAGLGTLAMQTPAGWATDRICQRRILFAVIALITGVSLAVLPWFSQNQRALDSLLFLSGAAQSFFTPVLGALALGLAGHARLSRTMGVNQGWNHAGNIAAALLAMGLVSVFGLRSAYYAVGICSVFAASSVLFIRESDLNEREATGLEGGEESRGWRFLLRDRRVLFLFVSILLFHFANAPILPTVAMYVKKLGGSDRLMTATVLSAQLVMVPVAYFAGKLCDSWGRKAVMGIAFWVLPLRIASYSLAGGAGAIVLLQTLDGVGAGIYGVAVAAFSADLTRGKGAFNTLMGIFATALAIGGVAGPLVSGYCVEHFGFRATFMVFSAIAGLGAVVFSVFVPETGGIGAAEGESAGGQKENPSGRVASQIE